MSDPATSPRPTSAGMYDYYLGGDEHSPSDRAAAEQILQNLPEVVDAATANRGFLQRAVTRMASEWGIRQFIDIGAGLPTRRNTHDVLADVTRDGRVIYVDIDPQVVARGNALLTDHDHAAVIEADVRRPDDVITHPETRRLIDFSQPVGLLIVAVLHFVPDEDDPWQPVKSYLDAVPPGSYLALSHGTGDGMSPRLRQALTKIYEQTPTPPADRTRTEIEQFFRGLEIMPPYPGAEPELIFAGLWGADDPDQADSDGSRMEYAAVARKP